MTDVTELLADIEHGDSHAAERLLPLVYDELRRLAAQRMAKEQPGQTLEATALVHEAYVRLVNVERAQSWDSRGHFFAAAAEAMRRILIENARRKRGPQRGGNLTRVDLDDCGAFAMQRVDDLFAVNDALTKFAEVAPQKAELVKLRYFAGMTIPEAADVLKISHATAERYWAYARVWLYSEIHGDSLPPARNS